MLGVLSIAAACGMIVMAYVAAGCKQTGWKWTFITFAVLNFVNGIGYFIL